MELTDGLHWFHQTHSFVVDCTTLSVVDAAVQQLSLLVHQITLIEAVVLTVDQCQPDVTELLLPFHSDDVIIWTFYQIDTFHRNSPFQFIFCLTLFLDFSLTFSINYVYFLPFLFACVRFFVIKKLKNYNLLNKKKLLQLMTQKFCFV